MIRGLLREASNPGTGKTQTRRILKPQPQTFEVDGKECDVGLLHIQGDQFPSITVGRVIPGQVVRCAIGDRLWAREAWNAGVGYNGVPPREIAPVARINYLATPDNSSNRKWGVYRPAMFMPRWASRLTLTVTDVRVQRLQEIDEDDAIAEGITREKVIVDAHCAGGRHTEVHGWRYFYDGCAEDGYDEASAAYAALWEQINGPGSWSANPIVVVLSFSVKLGNIDG
jgi:hypothetical protein